MASGSQNMTTFKAKGLTSIANAVDTSNFIFLKSTTLTADQLGNTVSLSLNATAVTGAAYTNHSIFLNAGVGSGLGTPFQLQIPDSSHLYIYKRWYTSGAWSGWSKVSAGHADDAAKWTTARTITLTGSVTGSVSMDGSGNVSLATTTNHNHDSSYVNIGGDTMSGDLLFSNSGTTTRQVRGIVGDNDYWRIAGGATAANAGWMEIATADDGNEPVYVRQYTGAYTTIKRTLTLLDANGHTSLPGNLTMGGNITISHAVSNDMAHSSANPKITFSENDTQPVHIIYCDWDSYRAPAGLKIVGGTSATPAWFEVEGNIYNGDSIYTTKAGECGLEVNNTQATNPNQGAFIVGSSGNLGIYSRKHSKWVVACDASGNVSLNGNAGTATTWQTARTLTVGNKGQSVNGSANVSWSLNDILYNATTIGTDTSWDQTGPSVYYVASSKDFTGTHNPSNNSEIAPYTYGQLIVSRAGSGGVLQVYASHHSSGGGITHGLRYRTGWNSGSWDVWSTLLDDRLWRKYIFANKNIGRSTLTVTDSSWSVTAGVDIFGLSFKDSGLTYTPSGGSATVSTDSGDWRAWLTCASNANTVELNMRIDGSWQASKFIGPLQGNADTATRIKGNLAAATSNVNRNIWVSSGAGADGIPNYISYFNMNPSTNVFSVPAGTRISPNTGALYLGNSGNQNWVYVQDMCGQDGQKWKIHQNGNAEFTGTVTAPTFKAGNDNATYSSDRCKVYAANGTVGIHSATNRGLYEFTDSKWIIYLQNSDDTVRSGYKIYGAVWNDFAEMREGDITEGGYAVYDDGHGHMKLCTERLQPGARLTSDTFGIVVGHTETAKTPIGVAGRVLVYPAQERTNYKVGDAVCAASNGRVDIMTREEIMMYPERILGIVSEIPDYEVWNQRYKAEEEKEYTETNIPVNGRIWIYVR